MRSLLPVAMLFCSAVLSAGVTSPDGEYEVVVTADAVTMLQVQPQRHVLWKAPATGKSLAWDIQSPRTEEYDLFVSRDRKTLAALNRAALTSDAVALRFFEEGKLVREYRLKDLLTREVWTGEQRNWCESAEWNVNEDNDEFTLVVRYPESGRREHLSFEPWTGRLGDRSTVAATVHPWVFWSCIAGVFTLLIGGAAFLARRRTQTADAQSP